MSEIRTRFAPSPTGYLHVGGARTALFNWLVARKNSGKLILRIEDTDEKRNTPEALDAITKGLSWLGVDWDEGPGKGGPYGPYFQSERGEVYEKYLAKLQAGGHVFEDEGSLRFRSPRKIVVLEDMVCGKITFDMSNPATHPDMTIRRPDGSWIFHFVNVVDDIEMRITHVIRGEDHLSNTPKHIELYQALGIEPPRFAHIPLILNKDGKKLSKRDGGSSVDYFIENGYAPEAVANYLCLLGWSPKDNREELSMADVLGIFSLEQVNRRNAIFDLDKCYWLNGQHLLHMSLERYTELCLPFLQRAGLPCNDAHYLRRVLEIVKPKVKKLSDVPAWAMPFFADKPQMEPEAVASALAKQGTKEKLVMLAAALSEISEWNHETIESALKKTAAANGGKAGDFVHPARVAISGRTVGPGLYEMMEVLGREQCLQRLRDGMEIAS